MELTKQIREALASSNKIEFDLTQVTDLELPTIQILYAASQSARLAGGEARLVGSVQDTVASRFLLTGFTKTLVKDGQTLQDRMPGFNTLGVGS